MIADIASNLKEGLPVIISLIIIEGLLSVDNILAIAALASGLPEKHRKTALRLGLAGAYVFRGVALAFAGFIMATPLVKFLGACYLIHLMASHFSQLAAEGGGDAESSSKAPRSFWGTVMAIQLMDLSLSVDNVVTAVAMSDKMWVVCTGVCLGLLTLWLFATLSLKLVEKYPILQHTAFLLIGYVGCILLVEMVYDYGWHEHLHIGPGWKFVGIVIILGLSLWYSRDERFRGLGKPFVKLGCLPMIIYAKVSNALIAVTLWPFKRLVAVFFGDSSDSSCV